MNGIARSQGGVHVRALAVHEHVHVLADAPALVADPTRDPRVETFELGQQLADRARFDPDLADAPRQLSQPGMERDHRHPGSLDGPFEMGLSPLSHEPGGG